MSKSTPTTPPKRRDRLLGEVTHDTYKLRGRLAEPTLCPTCGAVFHKGRWSWTAPAGPDAAVLSCAACQRIADNYPAGEVALAGDFAVGHKEEMANLARNVEQAENREHPMNRIIEIRDTDDGFLVTTTDVHLPRRIGRAVHAAWGGCLEVHFDTGGCFTRVRWRRD